MALKENETQVIDLIDISKKIWGKRKKIITWVAYGLLIGIVIWISKPNIYTSSTVMAPESKHGASNYSSLSNMASLVGASIPGTENEGVSEKLYPRIIASTPFLLEFAKIKVPYKKDTLDLYEYFDEHQRLAWWSYILKFPGKLITWTTSMFRENENKPFDQSQVKQEKFAYLLQKSISVKAEKEDKVIVMSVMMQDPVIAAIVADSLYSKLEHYITKYRTKRTRTTLEISIQMYEQAKHKYYLADSIYAVVADKSQNMVSKSANVKLDRLENEKNLALSVYRQLSSQVEMDQMKLLEETPIATIIEPVRIPLGPSSPNMIMTIVMCAFLGGLICTGIIIAKELIL